MNRPGLKTAGQFVAVVVALLGLVGSQVRADDSSLAVPPQLAREVGSKIVVHGWSKDSRLVAYTRHRIDGRSESVEQRMHRFVKNGAFAGFGRMVGGDVARYALERGYVASPLILRRSSPTRLDAEIGGHELALVFDVGQAHGWKFLIDGVERASHRFDRIYIGFEAEIFPSPDGKQAVTVMHLDTGWEVDAAIFALSLESIGLSAPTVER